MSSEQPSVYLDEVGPHETDALSAVGPNLAAEPEDLDPEQYIGDDDDEDDPEPAPE